MTWEVELFREPPSVSHARPLPEMASRSVWVFKPTVSALVLGSAQRAEVDAPIEVVRRRSGGGAVLVVPGHVLWIDVILPAGDPLWDADIGRASGWVGDVWAAALASFGAEPTVHRGGLLRAPWSDQVCFAGLGPGELLNEAGEKVVGIAQRRTRSAARFQCAALARWDADAIVGLMGLPDEARIDLQGVAAGVGVPLDDLLAAFLASLP